MKLRAIIVCVLLISDAAQAAQAQSVPDVATDQELFAAYCLGSFQQWAKELTSSGNAELDISLQPVQRDLMTRTSSLQAYLRARGLTMGIRSLATIQAVVTTIQRGRADETACNRQIEICVQKCSAVRPYNPKCTHSCRDEEPACRSVARCANAERLPP